MRISKSWKGKEKSNFFFKNKDTSKKPGTVIIPDDAGIDSIVNTKRCSTGQWCEKMQKHIDFYKKPPLMVITNFDPEERSLIQHCPYCKSKIKIGVSESVIIKGPITLKFKP